MDVLLLASLYMVFAISLSLPDSRTDPAGTQPALPVHPHTTATGGVHRAPARATGHLPLEQETGDDAREVVVSGAVDNWGGMGVRLGSREGVGGKEGFRSGRGGRGWKRGSGELGCRRRSGEEFRFMGSK